MENKIAELEHQRTKLLQDLKGLGFVDWNGLASPLTLVLRRRESYLLGELRGIITAIFILTGK